MPTFRTRRLQAATIFAALVLVAAGCSGGGDGGDKKSDAKSAPTEASDDGGTWTVLHYSVADNNLEQPMSADVNELGEVGSTGGLQVREYLDRSPDYGDDEVLDQGSWVGARTFDIKEGGTTELVADLGDTDSSDPQTLADFIAQGLTDLPADHYALVISDHGGQWNGIGQDETSGGGLLTLSDLVDGISAGLDGAGVDKLDLLGFDACLMAGYEVASAMAPLADRMVASQESEPGHGWDYTAFDVAADGSSVDALGSSIIDGFESQSEEAGDVAGVTLSMVDLTQMDELDQALEDFSSALAAAPDVSPVVGRAQTEVIAFGKSPDPVQDQHLSDLGRLADVLAEEAPEVAEQADLLTQAVDAMVVDNFVGSARQGATGLSIYLPPTYDLYSADYDELTGPWASFLDSYYGVGESIASDAIASWTQYEPDVEIDEDGDVVLTASYDPASQDNLTRATITYAFVEDDGTVTYFGEESAELGTADDPTAYGTFDFTALQMSDGEDTVTAYTDLAIDVETDTATIDVPLTYYVPEDVDFEYPLDILLSLTLDISGDAEITSEVYYFYDEATSTYGEAQLEPEGIIYPVVANYDDQGNETWLTTSDVGLYANLEDITYEFAPLDSGTELQMDLVLYDFGGNESYSTTFVDVP